MSYLDSLGENVRLTILQLLLDMPAYRGGDVLLKPAIKAMGLPCTGDQLRTHIAWLAEQSLVTRTESGPIVVAQLTERGGEAARGEIAVPGVMRPEPGR